MPNYISDMPIAFYCVKKRPYLYMLRKLHKYGEPGDPTEWPTPMFALETEKDKLDEYGYFPEPMNGFVAGSSSIGGISFYHMFEKDGKIGYTGPFVGNEDRLSLEADTLLTKRQLLRYQKNHDGIYCWNISYRRIASYTPLNVVDKKTGRPIDPPMFVPSYVKIGKLGLKRPPQSWCYCNIGGKTGIVLSINPIWLCRIMNFEKRAEVRTSAPKDVMIWR